MSITLGDVLIHIKSDSRDFDSGLKRAEDRSRGFAGAVGGILQTGLGMVVGGAINAGFNAVATGFSSMLSGMISGNAAFEQYNTQFRVMLGSAEAAEERMQALADFGQKTPFELPEVVEADRILQGFGLHATDVAQKFGFSGEQIRTIAGDVASGTGSSFQEMSLLLGRFSSGATGEAIRRMQELGITSRSELGEMGLEFSKSGELLSPLPQSMEVVLKLMQKKYGGLMDAQSHTFSGMMSNLNDWVGSTLRTLGQPLFSVLSNQLSGLLALLGSPLVKSAIDSMVASMTGGIGSVVSWINTTGIPAFISLAGYLLEWGNVLVNNWTIVKGALLGVLSVLGGTTILFVIGAALAALTSPITLLIAGAALLGAAWTSNWGNIQGITTQVFAFLLPYLSQLWTWLQVNLPVALQTLGTFWSTSLQPALQGFGDYLTSTVIPTLSVLWTWLQTSLPPAIQALSTFWTGTLLPAIITTVSYIQANVLPLFNSMANLLDAVVGKSVEGLAALWTNTLFPALQTVGAFLSSNLSPALNDLGFNIVPMLIGGFEKLTTFIQSLTETFNTWADQIKSIEIDPQIEAHSPTPFEMGLRGIADAINQIPPIDLNPVGGIRSPLGSSSLSESSSSSSVIGEINININGAGSPAEVGNEVERRLTRLFDRTASGAV